MSRAQRLLLAYTLWKLKQERKVAHPFLGRGGGILRLQDASDVDISALGNNKILVYKTASGKHEYEVQSGGGGAPTDAEYVVTALHADLTAEKLHNALTGADLHDPKSHAVSHESGGSDTVNHDSLVGFVAAEHVSLPNLIVNVLTDHTKATHDALGLSHDSLADVSSDDHHAKLHAGDHLTGGADPLALTDAEVPNTITLDNITQITSRAHSNLQSIGADDHHRKWSWADEGSWTKRFPLPYGDCTRQNNGNAIIIPTGNWTSIEDATVIYDGTEKIFYIWYAGAHTSYTRAIGLAKFDHTTNTTTYLNGGNPVVIPTDVDPSATVVRYPSVIQDGSTYYMAMMVKIGGTWYIYSGQSTDKINWSNFTQLLTGYTSPTWIKLGDMTYMVVKSATNLNMRCGIGKGSTRYTSITLHNRVLLEKGATGEWDETVVGDPTIYWSLGIFYLLYAGAAGTTTPRPWKTGLAISPICWARQLTDSAGNTIDIRFEKFGENDWNPVFDVGATGKFDDYAVTGRDIVMIDDVFYFFYAGHDGNGWVGIGYATIQ